MFFQNFEDYGFDVHYDEFFGDSDYGYEDFQNAYRYGYDAAMSDDYKGRGWSEVEDDLKMSWGADDRHGVAWADAEAAVRHAWEKVRGDID